MQFLSKENTSYFWGKIKDYVASVKTALETAISTVGAYTINGKAISSNPTLSKSDVGLGKVDNTSDANKPISTATQTALDKKQDTLVSGTNIKTINGTSVLGSGNISIDLTLYKIVESLPTSGIDSNKIYLVLSGTAGTNNKYTEYMYVNSAWEKVGEYTAAVDLTPYAKTADVNTALAKKADASDTYTKAEVDSKVTASGTFSEADATKLAGIETGAQVNQNALAKVVVGSTTITASAKQDTLTLAAGSNVTLTPDATNKKVTIAAKDTTYSAATTSAAGLMSATDKAKLDGIATGADKTTVDSALSSTSTNPVQNKVINTALAGKQATLTAGSNITISGSTISATNTTYSDMTGATSSAAGTHGLVPAPAAGKNTAFLRGDGTWVVPTNTTYSVFVKSGTGAAAGLVPAPSTTAGTSKYLREDGTWVVPTNTTYSVATASANGLMSSAMVTKLNGIATGATADSELTEAEIDAICV